MQRRDLLALLPLLAARPAFAAGSMVLGGNGPAIDEAIRAMLDGEEEGRKAEIARLVALKDRGAVAPLIQMMFWIGMDDEAAIPDALAALTGERPGESFQDWMVWLEEHPEYRAYDGYAALAADLFGGLDPRFRRFLRGDVAHAIRLEEIVWGGVKVDAIPALDDPKMTSAEEAGWLAPEDRVFGVAIGGDVRAYPLRIMNWHEMANDTVGGVPVSLAYCTLCGAGMLYDGRAAGMPSALSFGTSGLLYHSNKLMFDRMTDSLWSQFTGRPVVGPLVGSGLTLKPLPLVVASWQAWRRLHPGTKVLSRETGFPRDYGSEGTYAAYFASPDLAFPAALRDRSLAAKEKVFGVRVPGGARAWPLDRFRGGAVVNARVGLTSIVMAGDAAHGVRAYDSGGRIFSAMPGGLRAADGDWTTGEDALTGPGGQTLARLPGGVSYWFAWSGAFGGTLEK